MFFPASPLHECLISPRVRHVLRKSAVGIGDSSKTFGVARRKKDFFESANHFFRFSFQPSWRPVRAPPRPGAFRSLSSPLAGETFDSPHVRSPECTECTTLTCVAHVRTPAECHRTSDKPSSPPSPLLCSSLREDACRPIKTLPAKEKYGVDTKK